MTQDSLDSMWTTLPRAGDSDSSHSDGGVAVEIGRPKLKEPPKYSVVLHNDDYTTMEFVIEVLKRYFHKNEQEAMMVMLSVHHHGTGVAGVYSFDIAETKAMQVEQEARTRGFPLKCTVEPEASAK